MKSVFISSTFKDMQAERDYLHEKIFPRLRRIAGQQGEDIQELDLRWGVDTYQMGEEESGYQVLRVCIDAIDRCRPFIIVLLGERYGWIPDEAIVASLHDERVEKHYESSMSITNLEIKYGALSEGETLERCIFCFRDRGFIQDVPSDKRGIYDAESGEHRRKLEFLKEQIRGKEHARIIDYSVRWDAENDRVAGLEEFGDQVYAFMAELLQEDDTFVRSGNVMEQYLLDSRYTQERYLSVYTPRLQEENQCAEVLCRMAKDKQANKDRTEPVTGEGGAHCLHIFGEGGSGKSALLAVLSRLAEENGGQVIAYFSGNTGCQSLPVLKLFLIYRLEEILELEHRSPIENANAYLRELNDRILSVPVYCFIDALDQLFEGEENGYLDVIELCPHMHFITSSLADFSYGRVLKKARKLDLMPMRQLSGEDKTALIRRTGAYRGKKIDAVVEEMICSKPGSGNPLFLSLLLQRLFTMRQDEFQEAEQLASGMDGLHRYMERLIVHAQEELGGLSLALFERVSEIFGSPSFGLVTQLIAASSTGLGEREIMEIMERQSMEFSQLRFQEILYYLYDVFSEKEDGKWVFAHRIFYEAVKGQETYEEEKILDILIDYASVNEEFMEREGYRHVLEKCHGLGIQVLTGALTWKNRSAVEELAEELTRKSQIHRDWFAAMLHEEHAEALFRFWNGVRNETADQAIVQVQRKLAAFIAGQEQYSGELRLRAFLQLADYDTTQELKGNIAAAKVILAKAEAEILQKYAHSFTYLESAYLFETGREKEAFEKAKEAIRQAEESYRGDTESENYIQKLVYYRNRYVQRSEEYKQPLPFSYNQETLQILDEYLSRVKNFEVMYSKARLLSTMIRKHPEKGSQEQKEYVKEGLKVSRQLADLWPELRSLLALANAWNLYGKIIEPEALYKYRYESFEVYKRIYQIQPLDYWKEYLADQGRLVIADATGRIRKGELDDTWVRRCEEVSDLSLRCYEELLADEYKDVSRSDYEELLLFRMNEDGFKYRLEEAAHWGEKAWESRRRKVDLSDPQELYMNFQIAATLAEIYEKQMKYRRALSFAREQYTWIEKLVPKWLAEYQLVPSLALLCRLLYYLQMDEEALLYAERGIALIEQANAKDQPVNPQYSCEVYYVKARIALKRLDIGTAEQCMESLEQIRTKHGTSKENYCKYRMLGADIKYEKAKTVLHDRDQYWPLLAKANAAYEYVIQDWGDMHRELLREYKTLEGFHIADGKIQVNKRQAKNHLLWYYYYMYAIRQKAETMRLGDLKDTKKNMTKIRIHDRTPVTYREEYGYLVQDCLRKLEERDPRLTDEAYLPMIRPFIENTPFFMLDVEAKDQAVYPIDLYYLCYMAFIYCQNGLRFEQLLDQFLGFMGRYNITSVLNLPKHLSFPAMWLDIYPHMRKRIQQGAPVLSVNQYFLGMVWVKTGCFEEALSCLELVQEQDAVFGKAVMLKAIAGGMAAMHRGDKEAVRAWVDPLQESEVEEAFDEDTQMLYQELKLYLGGKEELKRAVILVDYCRGYSQAYAFRPSQESTMRYLHMLELVAEYGLFGMLEPKSRKKYVEVLGDLRQRYFTFNVDETGLRRELRTWRERTEELAQLTWEGYTWRDAWSDFCNRLQGLKFRLYESLKDTEEGQAQKQTAEMEMAEQAKAADEMLTARNAVDETVMETREWFYDRLSVEMLQKTAEVFQRTGRFPVPHLYERLSEQLHDPGILHTYIHTYLTVPKGSEANRLEAAAGLFDRLLSADLKEWMPDFGGYVEMEEHIACLGKMKFFEDPDRLKQNEKFMEWYRLYLGYHARTYGLRVFGEENGKVVE